MVYELCGASATFLQMYIIRSVSLQTVSPNPIAVSSVTLQQNQSQKGHQYEFCGGCCVGMCVLGGGRGVRLHHHGDLEFKL